MTDRPILTKVELQNLAAHLLVKTIYDSRDSSEKQRDESIEIKREAIIKFLAENVSIALHTITEAIRLLEQVKDDTINQGHLSLDTWRKLHNLLSKYYDTDSRRDAQPLTIAPPSP
jgi:hypothetical protein